MSDPGEQKSKIVVDEDWKAQVEAEREQLRQQEHSQQDAQQAPAAEGEAGGESAKMPPASFPVLVSSLATQAVLALGQMADPAEGKPVVRPEIARHYIDMLGVLEQKTQGNLTSDEGKMLDGVLHELRMLYMSARSQAPAAPQAPPPAE